MEVREPETALPEVGDAVVMPNVPASDPLAPPTHPVDAGGLDSGDPLERGAHVASVWSAPDPVHAADASAVPTTTPSPHFARCAVPTRAIRWLSVPSALMALGLVGWQTNRLDDGLDWSREIAVAALLLAALSTVGLLAWTYSVVENARRVLAGSVGAQQMRPVAAAVAWSAPILVAASAGTAVAYLQSRIDDRVGVEQVGVESAWVPLAIAAVGIVIVLLVSYRPLAVISSVTRRVGGGSVDLSRWFWAPLSLFVVGAASLWALGAGGAYGEDFEGVAPAWAVGVVTLPPVFIVLVLAWRGGRAVEEAMEFAFDRRNGVHSAGVGRGRVGMVARALRADLRPPVAHDVRRRIRLVPGGGLLRAALVVALAALALLSIVGAIVMFLFWRETQDGMLLQSQRDRAWDTLDALRRFERGVALVLIAVVMVWSFVNVLNARLATGRRRNPLLAAAAWPAAAYGIWRVGDHVAGDDRIGVVVLGFAAQAAFLAVPILLLERSAIAVGAHQQPLRIAYGFGVILLIHTQGLAGLSTLDPTSSTEQFGKIAGYLSLAALLQLLLTLTITEASDLIANGARHEAEQHNFLAEQRREIDRSSDDAAATR